MRLVNKKHLAVLPAASTDETRYILNGIKFEETEKGLRAIATNGRMMAIVENDEQHDIKEFPVLPAIEAAKNTQTQAIVPTSAIKNMLKTWPKGKTSLLLQNAIVKFAEDVSTFATTDLESVSVTPARNIEGTYPNYQQVQPKTCSFQICINPLMLSELLVAASKIAGVGNSVTLSFNGNLNPMQVSAKDNQGFTFEGILMPMKADGLVDKYDEKSKGGN